MNPARTVFSALALTALLACEPVVEPETLSPAFSVGGGGGEVVESVTGSGRHFVTPPGGGDPVLRKLSLKAEKHTDGTFSGKFDVHSSDGGRARGTIICFGITGGNQARLAVFITRASNPMAVNKPRLFRVVDNGHHSHDPPDKISNFIPATLTGPKNPTTYCGGTAPFPPLDDILEGDFDIEVD